MIALEQQLTTALRVLSAQSAQAQAAVGRAGRTAQRARDALGPGLQDARRDVTRALDVMRHADRERGPELDFGPSR